MRSHAKYCSDAHRAAHYDSQHPRQRDLFSEANGNQAHDIGLGALASTSNREVNEVSLATLVPLARKLAERAGDSGITVSDVREAAERNGVGLPENKSALGSLMKKAGLRATGRMRRSQLESTHGRHQMVWTT